MEVAVVIGRNRILAGLAVIVLLVIAIVCVWAWAWAWADGGSEPLRAISEPVPLPETPA